MGVITITGLTEKTEMKFYWANSSQLLYRMSNRVHHSVDNILFKDGSTFYLLAYSPIHVFYFVHESRPQQRGSLTVVPVVANLTLKNAAMQSKNVKPYKIFV